MSLLPVRAELVEAPPFSWDRTNKGQGFDKLSPNGNFAQELLA